MRPDEDISRRILTVQSENARGSMRGFRQLSLAQEPCLKASMACATSLGGRFVMDKLILDRPPSIAELLKGSPPSPGPETRVINPYIVSMIALIDCCSNFSWGLSKKSSEHNPVSLR